jgi:hypothetical protein
MSSIPWLGIVGASGESIIYTGTTAFQGSITPDAISGGQVIVYGNSVNVFLNLNLTYSFQADEFITVVTLYSKIPKPHGVISAATSIPHLSFLIDANGQILATSRLRQPTEEIGGYVSFSYIGNPNSLGATTVSAVRR